MQPNTPQYDHMRAGIVACIAIVGDHGGSMASEMLERYSAPRIAQMDIDDVLVATEDEGSRFDLETGWRIAMCQLARIIDVEGDFSLSPLTVSRKWASFCVDTLRLWGEPLVNPENGIHQVDHKLISVTVYEERTGFGPLQCNSFAAIISDNMIARLPVKWSMAVARDRDTAIARLAEAVKTCLGTGQSADWPYAHVVI